MSSFVVNSETIDKIISAMQSRGMEYYARKYGVDTQEGADKFGGKLVLMNIEAVGRCYSGNTEALEEFRKSAPFPYQFREYLGDTISSYKAAQCLAYQCSEDDIPETWAMYKTLQAIIAALASRIIEDLPRYQSAAWG